MNLSTITMDPAEAAERAEPYRRLAVATIEEKQILAGYLALAAGKQLIRLSETIRAGGCDEHGWPRLAVMLATEPWCYLQATTRTQWAGPGRWDGRRCRLCDRDAYRRRHGIGPESLPTDGPARTVEVSDRTGRTDPDVP